MDYKKKYLKYKEKYINLKKELFGGGCVYSNLKCILVALKEYESNNIELIIENLKEINEKFGNEMEEVIKTDYFKLISKPIQDLIDFDLLCKDDTSCRENCLEYNKLNSKISKIFHTHVGEDTDLTANLSKLLLVSAPHYHLFKENAFKKNKSKSTLSSSSSSKLKSHLTI